MRANDDLRSAVMGAFEGVTDANLAKRAVVVVFEMFSGQTVYIRQQVNKFTLKESRVRAAAHLLAQDDSADQRQAVARLMQRYSVCKRTAQTYVKEARKFSKKNMHSAS